jgi:hypothetical protein
MTEKRRKAWSGKLFARLRTVMKSALRRWVLFGAPSGAVWLFDPDSPAGYGW